MASRALFDYVTFTCEVYGYSSPSSMFSWSVPGNNLPITMDILTYQLMNTYGNNSLQSGGSTLGKSRISSLYLRIFSEKDYGSYTCAYGLSSATATLLPPPPPGTPIYGDVLQLHDVNPYSDDNYKVLHHRYNTFYGCF